MLGMNHLGEGEQANPEFSKGGSGWTMFPICHYPIVNSSLSNSSSTGRSEENFAGMTVEKEWPRRRMPVFGNAVRRSLSRKAPRKATEDTSRLMPVATLLA